MDKFSILDEITKITDDLRLFEIYRDNDDFDVKYAIANLIKDDSLLYDIFSNEENPIIKSLILDRISEDILDFNDFASLDVYEKITYIENHDNESLLFNFAQNDEDLNVRFAAIYKIQNNDFIMKMAESHDDYDTRIICLKKLNGMTLLDEITYENLAESRINLIKTLKDEKFLKDIALNDFYVDVKIEALRKLNEPDFYVDVIKNTSNRNSVMRLMDEIRDESHLADIVMSFEDQFIVENSVNRISNTRVLFELCRSGNEILREAAMKKLLFGNVFSSEKITERINIKNRISDIFGDDSKDFETDTDFKFRLECIQNIRGSDILADIARNDSSWKVRSAAVEWISSEDFLVDIARNDSKYHVRCATVGRISSEDVLVDIARTDPVWNVRCAAVERICREDVLSDIAKTDSDNDVQKAAVSRISREEVLVDIAIHASGWVARREAVRRIGDEDVLADIAGTDSSYRVRIAALEKIGDEKSLIDIALNDSDDDARVSALYCIDDDEVLLDIYRNDSAWFVRYKAVSRIGDDDVLIDIYKNETDNQIRGIAFYGISRQDVLVDALRNDCDMNIRQMALEKIDDANTLKKLILENYGYFSTDSYSAFKRDYENLIYDYIDIRTYNDILDLFEEYDLLDIIHEKLFSDFRVLITKRLVSSDSLRDLALKDLDYHVRLEAVKNLALNDEETFLKIFKSDSNDSVRFEALKRLDDAHISRDMINDSNVMIGLYAYTRLNESATLTGNVVFPDDIDMTLLESITDENVLYSIVNYSSSSSVKKFAFKKIRDERILTDIVFYNRQFRNSAFNRIKDNALLLKIALYSTDQNLKRDAVKRIDDERILLEAVMGNPYNDISPYIIDRIRDEALLEIIAFNNSNPFNRKAAVNRIENSDILLKLGEIESDEQVCTAILRKNNDLRLLEYMGLSNPTKTVRRYVASITDDDDLLYKFAMKEFHFDNRREIISRIRNEEYILNLLKRETVSDIFKTDFKITNPEILVDLAINSRSDEAIEYALRNINDKSVLYDFIYSSPYVSQSPSKESLWKDFRNYSKGLCMSVFLRRDFDDMNVIEEFFIENKFNYSCWKMHSLKEKITSISSIYRIALNCKSNKIRQFFKSKLKYSREYGDMANRRNSNDDGDEETALVGLGALFG